MILKGSYRIDVFLRSICKCVSLGGVAPASFENDDVTYIGAGYWRCRQVVDETEEIIGLRLINPDRTAEEIAAVERGVAILCHLDYQPG